jgi:hypothetical protein
MSSEIGPDKPLGGERMFNGDHPVGQVCRHQEQRLAET